MYVPKTKKLLTTNAKLNKESGFTVRGLDLAPGNSSGREVCPEKGACYDVCIGFYSGFHVMDSVRQAQKNRTNWFFEDRASFLEQLHKELRALEKQPNPACRLNVDSDLAWESIDRTLFDYNIMFYDYTKRFNRAMKSLTHPDWPENYTLTYSWNERSDKRKVNRFLKMGGNINMVHATRYKADNLLGIPSTMKIGTKVWETRDFDKQDVRIPEKDGKGVVGLVRAKIKTSIIPEYVEKGFFVEGNKV